jgi:5'-deoxynucleotidase YfbR-like HD superfamily hydrolase
VPKDPEAADPAPQDAEAVALVNFAFEMGILKRLRRTGWSHAGIRDGETVAEHSLRAAQLAVLIAAQEGADPARAAHLAIWHDSQETRTGDVPHTARPYLGRAEARAITTDQTARLPQLAAQIVHDAVEEYETHTTIESICAYDADKLECLLQALEYQASGNINMRGWIDSSRAALTTTTARRIADAALTESILAWRRS